MNVWNFTGNLGGDCEIRHSPNGDPITSFSVAVKSGYGDRETTIWARCSMFGRRGESVSPYLLKGQLVGVSGELNVREWQDKEARTRTSIEVRVNDLTLLGKREDNFQRPQQHTVAPAPAPTSKTTSVDFDDDEPPF